MPYFAPHPLLLPLVYFTIAFILLIPVYVRLTEYYIKRKTERLIREMAADMTAEERAAFDKAEKDK